MSWINTLSAAQWLVLALIPPAIIALYFLKLKRSPVLVPSTYLWRRSIEDLHVNSLWQKMRQNLLLLLQLLLIAMIIIALLRPNWMSTRLAGERLIFLVDNSASMSSTDVEGSRLEDAKRRVARMIDAMESGQQAMIVSFSDTARVEQALTDSRVDLKQALESIQPTNRPTALEEALRVAAGLTNPNNLRDDQAAGDLEATLYIVSDGKFADIQGFSLGSLKPVFLPVGETKTPNLAIVAFSTRPHEDNPGQLQAFGRIENYGSESITTQAELLLNDALIDASQLTIAAGESSGVVFDLGNVSTGVLQLRVTHEDALPIDNRAWAAVNSPRRSKILVITRGNDAISKVFSTSGAQQVADIRFDTPEFLKTTEYQRNAAAGAFDLIIFDRCRPNEMPRCNTMFIDELPLAGWSAGESVIAPQVIDVARAHPLMQYVEFGDVEIFEAKTVVGPPGTAKLLETTGGPIVAIAPREGFEDAVLGFGFYSKDEAGETLPNTTWPIRQSFPVFMLNALAYLGQASDLQTVASVRPGEGLELRTESTVDRLDVRDPAGNVTQVLKGSQNAFPFTKTGELGVYEVSEGGDVTQRFAVNLSDSSESNIATRADPIQIGYSDVPGEAAWESAPRELWKWLLLAALVVLLFEWYIYNRRVYM